MIWYDMVCMVWCDMMIWYVIYDIWYDTIPYHAMRYDIRYDMVCMVWYDMMIWYDMMWYDMIWYDTIPYHTIRCDIWYDMVCMVWYDMMIWYNIIWYDMIYLLNCNWVATRWQQYSTHLHTNSTQNNTKVRNSAGRALSLQLYPGICLTTEEKARKNLSEGSRSVPAGAMKVHRHTIRIHKLQY
jgi:hypothetical protein